MGKAWGWAIAVTSVLATAGGPISEFPPLSTYAPRTLPWLSWQANSEQRHPLYLGPPPREGQGVRLSPRAPVPVPEPLKDLGERQLRALEFPSAGPSLEVEAWPVVDDYGRLTWAFARWRSPGERAWRWSDSLSWSPSRNPGPAPLLAERLRPDRPGVFSRIFSDFLRLGDLYGKPVFGDCVWVRGETVVAAWLSPEQRSHWRHRRGTALGECLRLPQPARHRGRPVSFVLTVDAGAVRWPGSIRWEKLPPPSLPPVAPDTPPLPFPRSLADHYRRDVEWLSGERTAVFPRSGRQVRFVRKNSADPNHQLEALVDYLEERYGELGLTTRRDRFFWRGIPQSNLVAVIPGTSGRALPPVLLADHIDTAFAEDTFARTGGRVSVPGADDNVSATAALLRAAQVLGKLRHRRDIWLVHLTGEEFPADCLGARRFVSDMLSRGEEIAGLVLLDMIGYRTPGDRVFQIHPGNSAASLRLAAHARAAARQLAPWLQPEVRPRFDRRSYLYNTDGIIFSDAGYPVILINEHLNLLENFTRRHYHETTDTSDRLDGKYAADLTRIAIATVHRLAQE